jgi:cleavage and polyadenylation specificity factor subunit 2
LYTDVVNELNRQAPTLSFILLTHATIAHLGAFAHCCKNFPLFARIPVYATTPVINLGRTLLQDIYSSTPVASTTIPQDALNESAYSYALAKQGQQSNILLQPPTSDEIAGYFSQIHPLKYLQPQVPTTSSFSPQLNGLTITAFNAGHTLGGTIWHIQQGQESVVYAVDWNQARELHLSGAAWLGSTATGSEVIDELRRPTAMVCSSRTTESSGRNKRDDVLLGMIRDTVANGGSVLIPSDSSARVLELAYLLENAWENDNTETLQHAKLYLASRTCGATMRFARSMLEWMEQGMVREFEARSGVQANAHQRAGSRNKNDIETKDEIQAEKTPFQFRHMKLLERKSKVKRAVNDTSPRVIVASDNSLEWGFSKDALQVIAGDPRNLIILTEPLGASKQEAATCSRVLWDLWNSNSQQSMGTVVDGNGHQFRISVARVSPLESQELLLYQQYLARQRQLHTVAQGEGGASLEDSADVVDERSSSSSSSSEDSDEERQGKALNVSTVMASSKHKIGLSDKDLGVNILLQRRAIHDVELHGKAGRRRWFPFVSKRKRVDEWGDVIRPEDYLRAEERDDAYGEILGDLGKQGETTLGQKRKWGEATKIQPGPSGREQANGVNGLSPRARRNSAESTSDVNMDGFDSDDEESPENETEDRDIQGPRRLILDDAMVELNCRLTFLDYSGLHDKRSLQMLIPLIRPRKLILVAGDEEETVSLAEECRSLLTTRDGPESADIFTPKIGEVVDASVDTNAWVVKITPELYRNIRWQTVKGLGVMAITGNLKRIELDEPVSEVPTKKIKIEDDKANATDGRTVGTDATPVAPSLDIVPANMATAARTHGQPLHVGDLRLAEFRRKMQEFGLTAEFRGEGMLLIDHMVIVRKTGTGKIEIEMAGIDVDSDEPNKHFRKPSSFYAVKNKIYEGLALVAGA